ncbi:aldehyde dehydrogenase family protein [Alicyclobacillus tolerans]|uniref:aldehyde dehydrogenase family protein n=1 Tax=Alicyclobacillus tolerans TaxID=90970 RepID=UPI001F2DBC67|nr:aldehyde dehydrogenase family protein [Alicyclobacillus tolerans]MCF8565331.1 aldehyde dehydrogenase family protein [Alicyclobacillus tolerans]
MAGRESQVPTQAVFSGPSTYVGGQWSTGSSIPVQDKFTGAEIGRIDETHREQVDAAVAFAEQSFQQTRLSPFERYELLRKTADWIREREPELLRLLIAEVGKTYKDTKVEIDRAVQAFLFSAEEAKRIGGEVLPVNAIPGAESKTGFAMRVPKGVIAAITPFNYPFLLAAHKVGPAIAAGNTVVLKPAPNTPFSAAFMLQGLLECGMPKNHVQLVQGGAAPGQALLENQSVRMYTFTGSALVGAYIKAQSGLRPVVLELGNSSPNIVLADADLDLAADLCGKRAFTAAGQACISVQRILVQRSAWDAFVPKLQEVVNQLKVGDPSDPQTDVGPMISEREASRARQWVEEAVADGAKVICGNRQDGAFFYPTLLTDVSPQQRVCREEVFAPVAVLIPFDRLDEAIAIANDTAYGLQAAVFTRSMPAIMKAWKELEFGGIVINDTSTFRSDLAPYGGVKNSGLGREGPRYAVEAMTDLRVLILDGMEGEGLL